MTFFTGLYSVLRPLDGLDVDAVLEHLPERRHLPQPPHLPHRPGHSVVDLLLRREPTDPESVEGFEMHSGGRVE